MKRVLFDARSIVLTGLIAFQTIIMIPHTILADDLKVTMVEPPSHTVIAPIHGPIVVHFDRPVNPSTINSDTFKAFGRWSGAVSGTYGFADGNQAVSLRPERPLSSGELVMVVLSHEIQALDSSFLRSAGYSWQFWTAAQSSALNFVEIDRMSTRVVPFLPSRAYGGIASDLNEDTFLDITIVNEDTADLRVFLNEADRTGLFEAFIQPTFPVRDRASPSEPADFNADGHVDICVANINNNTVSVLLGVGNGTFVPQQLILMGSAPPPRFASGRPCTRGRGARSGLRWREARCVLS